MKCCTPFGSKHWKSRRTFTLHASSCQSRPRGPKLGPSQHEALRSRTAATQRGASSVESWEEFALVPTLPACSCLRSVQPAFVSPEVINLSCRTCHSYLFPLAAEPHVQPTHYMVGERCRAVECSWILLSADELVFIWPCLATTTPVRIKGVAEVYLRSPFSAHPSRVQREVGSTEFTPVSAPQEKEQFWWCIWCWGYLALFTHTLGLINLTLINPQVFREEDEK